MEINKMDLADLKAKLKSGEIAIENNKYVFKASPKLVFGTVEANTVPHMNDQPKKVVNNARVKNATPMQTGSIKFMSKLEEYMYGLLTKKKINFEFQYKIVLQPKCVWHEETIREIAWIADFWLPDHNMVIDTKGWGTEILL